MGGVALSLPAIRQSGLLRTADRLCVEFSQDFAYHTSKYTCNLDKHATRGGINKMRIWSSPDLKGCISRKHYVDATRLSARSDLPLEQRYRRPQQRGGKSATWVRGGVHAITRFFSWSRFRSFFLLLQPSVSLPAVDLIDPTHASRLQKFTMSALFCCCRLSSQDYYCCMHSGKSLFQR